MEISWAQAKCISGRQHSPSVYNRSTSGSTFPRCHRKPLPFISQPIRTSRINRSAILRQRTIHHCIITSLIHGCRLSTVLIETHCSPPPPPPPLGLSSTRLRRKRLRPPVPRHSIHRHTTTNV